MARLFDDQEKIAVFVLEMDNLLEIVSSHEVLFPALVSLLQKTSSDVIRCKVLTIICGSYLNGNPARESEVVKVILPLLVVNVDVRFSSSLCSFPPFSIFMHF